MFQQYYDATPARPSCSNGWKGVFLPSPWTNDAELRASIAAKAVAPPDFAALRQEIAALASDVRRNRADFSAFALSAEYLEHVYARQKPTAATIASIAEADRVIVEKLEAEWNSSRPADSPGKSQPLTYLNPQDQLLFRMREAARYSAELARNPTLVGQVCNLRRIFNPPLRSLSESAACEL